MCLAVPGRVVECRGEEAVVDLQGNTLKVSTVLTPGVATGDWVLIHAGFAITRLDEAEALQTWDYLREVLAPGPPPGVPPPQPGPPEEPQR